MLPVEMKLMKAMKEISEVIERHDVGGILMLHAPNTGVYKDFLQPSYSCIKKVPGGIEIPIKPEQYPGPHEEHPQKLNDTLYMIETLVAMMENRLSLFQQIRGEMRKETGFDPGQSHCYDTSANSN